VDGGREAKDTHTYTRPSGGKKNNLYKWKTKARNLYFWLFVELSWFIFLSKLS